ncbi:MAG TPA: winged helix DNA-binding domain-containing protein [Ardenticatenaceae bacterium]
MRSLTWSEVHQRRLERNYLLESAPPEQMIHVVGAVRGLQAQVLTAAELGISARVVGVTQQQVREQLWKRRHLVKTYSLRGTVHLHPADELPLWTAARRGLHDWREGRWHETYNMDQAQARTVLDALTDALDGRGLTREELADAVARCVGSWARERIASTWADLIGLGFDAGLLCFGPNRGNKVTFVRADQWLSNRQEIDPTEALADIFRHYLATYGPATPQDFARWFMPQHLKPAEARELADSLANELEEVEVEGERAWLLAADADTGWQPLGTSLRLLPQYDCYIIGSRFGRERIVPESARARVFAHKNGRFEGAVGLPLLLIDGVVAGMWERRKRGSRTEIRVEPFIHLTAHQSQQLEAEALRSGEFLGTEIVLLQGALAGPGKD